jgi:hypothetical protein
MVARRGNLSVRPLISLTNPEVFNPLWLDLYRQADSHWECMRSLLAMVWLKNGGDLTWGEMLHLFDQIDATADGYFAAVHGEAKKLYRRRVWGRQNLRDVRSHGGREGPLRLCRGQDREHREAKAGVPEAGREVDGHEVQVL